MKIAYTRVGWLILSALTVAWLADISTDSLMQITDCELGLSVAYNCDQTIGSYFGLPLIGVLALPVLLCIAPAVYARPGAASIVVSALALLFIIGLISTVAGSSKPDMPSVYIYLLPVVLIAFILAATNRWIRSRYSAVNKHAEGS
ncbi:hypothetical protein F8M49_21685 [Rhodococcus zopfii]|uniref:Uncharacterized protein n=1 Tax=Rhodococcus zopfii TaxID=43772 RepID=A0ABU3WVC3_9NOCA|nr:hypothetical protein [Rhodococcus zopfii]